MNLAVLLEDAKGKLTHAGALGPVLPSSPDILDGADSASDELTPQPDVAPGETPYM